MWILVIFTIDRFIAVVFPLQKRRLCGPFRAQMYCALALLAAVAKNFHVFWTRGAQYRSRIAAADVIATASPANQKLHLDILTNQFQTPQPVFSAAVDDNGGGTDDADEVLISNCGRPSDAYYDFEMYVRPWIAFALVSVLPFVVIAICNVFIVQALMDVKRIREKQIASSMTSLTGATSTGTGNSLRRGSGSNAAGVKASADRTLVQMTAMCLSASFCFLICITPSIVLLIGRPYWAGTDEQPNVAYDTAKAASNILVYVNHSLNFFLYSLTGKRFRTQLVAMVTFKKRQYNRRPIVAAAPPAHPLVAAPRRRRDSSDSQSSASDVRAAVARQQQQARRGGRKRSEPLYRTAAGGVGGGGCDGRQRLYQHRAAAGAGRARSDDKEGQGRGQKARAIYRLGSGVTSMGMVLNVGLVQPRDGAARGSGYKPRVAHVLKLDESEL